MSEEEKDPGLEATDVLEEEDASTPVGEPEAESLSYTGRRSAVILPDGKRLGSNERVESQAYDFTKPALLGPSEMERLRRLHNELSSSLEAQTSLFFRSEATMSFVALEMLEYRKVLKELEDPTHLALFKAEPLPGIGLLEISPRLALAAVNQILGGKGQAPKTDRALTKIETDLIEEFLLILIQQWCGQWLYETNPVPSIVGHEVIPSTLQICEEDTVMLQFIMDVTIREGSGRIQIVVPLYMVEGMIRHLESKQVIRSKPHASVRPPSWQQGYGNVPLPAEVSISIGSMKVGEFNALKVGDSITLPEGCMEQAVLRLAKKPMFVGQFGVDNGKMALCIQSKLQS